MKLFLMSPHLFHITNIKRLLNSAETQRSSGPASKMAPSYSTVKELQHCGVRRVYDGIFPFFMCITAYFLAQIPS